MSINTRSRLLFINHKMNASSSYTHHHATVKPTIASSITMPMPPLHVLAQKLNNRAAAFLITPTSSSSIGNNYDEGIFLLAEALELTEQAYNDEIENERSSSSPCCTRSSSSCSSSCSCSCQYCSLELCLTMDCLNNVNESKSESESESSRSIAAAEEEMDNWFVYRRPIFVHKDCIEGMHFMGAKLSIIILFNLALAHHLKAIASISTMNMNMNMNMNILTINKLLRQALQLYELAYQLRVDIVQHSHQHEQQQQQQPSSNNNNNSINKSQDNVDVASLRLTMIIFNNLGDIHRIIGNKRKHIMCLQHFLTIIMYIVDSNIYSNIFSSVAGEYYDTPNSKTLTKEMIDGFYQNVSAIMFGNDGYDNYNTSTNVYAQAA
jgi:hypothetical protein